MELTQLLEILIKDTITGMVFTIKVAWGTFIRVLIPALVLTVVATYLDIIYIRLFNPEPDEDSSPKKLKEALDELWSFGKEIVLIPLRKELVWLSSYGPVLFEYSSSFEKTFQMALKQASGSVKDLVRIINNMLSNYSPVSGMYRDYEITVYIPSLYKFLFDVETVAGLINLHKNVDFKALWPKVNPKITTIFAGAFERIPEPHSTAKKQIINLIMSKVANQVDVGSFLYAKELICQMYGVRYYPFSANITQILLEKTLERIEEVREWFQKLNEVSASEFLREFRNLYYQYFEYSFRRIYPKPEIRQAVIEQGIAKFKKAVFLHRREFIKRALEILDYQKENVLKELKREPNTIIEEDRFPEELQQKITFPSQIEVIGNWPSSVNVLIFGSEDK